MNTLDLYEGAIRLLAARQAAAPARDRPSVIDPSPSDIENVVDIAARVWAEADTHARRVLGGRTTRHSDTERLATPTEEGR